jgi:putative transposase
MEIQKVTREFRLSQWASIMQSRIDSGQKVKDFCRTSGISKDAYYYWQHKLRQKAAEGLEKSEESKSILPSGWMQLVPKQAQQAKEAVNIEINGYNVTVNAQTDLELLKKVCLTLRSLG